MKIMIIKLGAAGDVIRTLPLATALKEKFENSEITWITKSVSEKLIQTDKNISRVLATVPQEDFDLLYNFDIEKAATEMALQTKARKKFGFYSENEYVQASNIGAEYYLNTIFDDELKKSNKKTYQEMMFEVAELPYEKKRYNLNLNDQEVNFGQDFLKKNNLLGKQIIGLHLGSSHRWPSKCWHEERIIELVIKLKRPDKEVILFSGQEDTQRTQKINDGLKSHKLHVLSNNPNNSVREFASLVKVCDVTVCSDSLALHVSIGLGKPTVGLFFCTSPDEVEDYGLLVKVVSQRLYDFFPEKMNQYNEELVKSISSHEVLEKVQALLKHRNK